MKSLKAIFKILCIIPATLLIYSCLAMGQFLLKLFRTETGRWRNYWLSLWGKTLCRILSVRVHVVGEKPQPPFFLVSNHLSYLDIIILYNILDTTFISKAEVRSWPVIGFMARTIGVIFIDRKRKSDLTKVNKAVAGQITQHQGVVLFPEGTTSNGEQILPFKPSILEHPAKSVMGVDYVYIRYTTGSTDPNASEQVCWWGDAAFGKHFYEFAKIHSVDAYIHFGSESVHHNDRKALAETLYQKVNYLHEYYSHPAEERVMNKEG